MAKDKSADVAVMDQPAMEVDVDAMAENTGKRGRPAGKHFMSKDFRAYLALEGILKDHQKKMEVIERLRDEGLF